MFERCPNFRDIGGFATRDGRAVRCGRVFRAGTLTNLGPADREAFAAFDIRVVCDLRHVDEREREPTRLRPDSAEFLHWDYQSSAHGMMTKLAHAEASPEDASAAMAVFYAGLPMALAPAIRDIFARIAHGQTPLLFHCAAGKDRTGVVAGLLQEILGVPRAAILTDYARSAKLMDYEAILAANPLGSLGLTRGGTSMLSIPRAVRAALLASEEHYLAATFARAESESGSVEAYLIDKIGVGPDAIAGVRAELLL